MVHPILVDSIRVFVLFHIRLWPFWGPPRGRFVWSSGPLGGFMRPVGCLICVLGVSWVVFLWLVGSS